MYAKSPMAHESGGTDPLDWDPIPESWTELGGTIVQADAEERIYYATQVAYDEFADDLIVKYVRPENYGEADTAFVRRFEAHHYDGGIVPAIVANSRVGGLMFPAVMRADAGTQDDEVRRDDLDVKIMNARYNLGAINHWRD